MLPHSSSHSFVVCTSIKKINQRLECCQIYEYIYSYVHTYARCITGKQETNNSEFLKSISDTNQLATCWNFVPILDVMYVFPGLVWRADPLDGEPHHQTSCRVRAPYHSHQVIWFLEIQDIRQLGLSRYTYKYPLWAVLEWFCLLVLRHNLCLFLIVYSYFINYASRFGWAFPGVYPLFRKH